MTDSHPFKKRKLGHRYGHTEKRSFEDAARRQQRREAPEETQTVNNLILDY